MPPQQTIKRIKAILSENDISVDELSWSHQRSFFASLKVAVSNLPRSISTNGKGINKRYALASAYAELMERIQNLMLFQKKYAGNQSVEKIHFSDGRPFQYRKFKKEHPNPLKSFFNEEDLSRLDILLENHQHLIHAYPYYHVTTDKITYLPYELLLIATGSNGMCAGNTPEEALVQGLCEIFERHVLREIYRNKDLILPVVPEEFFQKTFLWRYFKLLKKRGYEVYVKDCSLDGKIPVAGILIKKGDKAQFKLGSSPDFFIALERCFTELFQGFTLQTIDKRLEPIEALQPLKEDRHFSTREKRISHQYFKHLTLGADPVNPIIFNNNKKFNPNHIFRSESEINKKTLNTLVTMVHKLGYGIYMRDVSFLGFPSYHVYIPGMTETTRLDYNMLNLSLSGLPKAKKIFYNLAEPNTDELMYLTKTIQQLLDHPYIEKKDILPAIHHLLLTNEAVLNTVDPESILTMLYYRAGDITSAYTVYKDYLAQQLERMDKPRHTAKNHFCLVKFLEYMAAGYSLAEAKEKIEEEFGAKIIKGVYPLLKNPSGLSQYIGLPQCKECRSCRHQGFCSFKNMEKLVQKVQNRINRHHFNQYKIKECLNNNQ